MQCFTLYLTLQSFHPGRRLVTYLNQTGWLSVVDGTTLPDPVVGLHICVTFLTDNKYIPLLKVSTADESRPAKSQRTMPTLPTVRSKYAYTLFK